MSVDGRFKAVKDQFNIGVFYDCRSAACMFRLLKVRHTRVHYRTPQGIDPSTCTLRVSQIARICRERTVCWRTSWRGGGGGGGRRDAEDDGTFIIIIVALP